MIRHRLLRTGTIAVLTAAVGLSLAGVPAPATAGELAPRGSLALFARPDFTGVVYQTTYTGCATPITAVLTRPVVAYDNRPATGCQAVLEATTRPGETFKLCLGRGKVPLLFQDSPRVRIQRGDTPPCASGTAE